MRQKPNTMTGAFILGLVILMALLGALVGFMSNQDEAETTTASNDSAGAEVGLDSVEAVAGLDTLPSVISPEMYQTTFIQGETDHFLVDVRTLEEFEAGYIEGATNIEVSTVADRLAEFPKDKPIVVYCRSGNRSSQAAQVLRDAGYTQVYDLGGIIAWQEAGYTLIQ